MLARAVAVVPRLPHNIARRVVPGMILSLAVGLVVANDDPFGFMPDGGRGLVPLVFDDPADRAAALAQVHSADEWLAEITSRAPDMTEDNAGTLADYLAVVTPLDGPDLPPDGRDLALTHCQSCHSLFTGYLMQRRDRAAWLSTFASPFHTVIQVTDTEKAIFADYSARHMPLRIEDVPPELRF